MTRPLLRSLALLAALAVGLAATAQAQERNLRTREMDPLTLPPQTNDTGSETATLDRTHPPEPGPARPYDLPAVTERVLDNGLTVLLVDRPGFPTVSARLSLRAGRDQGEGNVALPLLAGRTLRDGTRGRSAEAIAEFIDGNGLDFDVNIGTNEMRLSGDALSNKLGEVLALFAELLGDATFPDDRVTSRRDELVAELELAVAQPSFHRDRLMRRVLFGEHPYGTLHPTLDQVRAVTPAALRAFYVSHYGPARATLVLVGDLPDDVDALLATTLGAWVNDVPAYEPLGAVALATCNTAHVVLRADSAQTSILWVGPGPSPLGETYVTAETANQVLGGGASARLFLNLRQDKSYTYGAYSRLDNLLGVAWFQATSDVRSEVTEPALVEFENEFNRLRSEALPEGELADAKQYLSGVFPLQLETNAALASRISQLVDIGLGVAYLEAYRGRVQAVTVADAEAVARGFVQQRWLTLVLVGEEQVVVPAARAHASRVLVYNLDGNLLREEDGTVESTCTP